MSSMKRYVKRKFCMRAHNPYQTLTLIQTQTSTLTLTKIGASLKYTADRGHVIYISCRVFVCLYFFFTTKRLHISASLVLSCLVLTLSCLVFSCVLFCSQPHNTKNTIVFYLTSSFPNLTSFPFLHQKPIDLVRGQGEFFTTSYAFQIKDIGTLKKVKGRERTCRVVLCRVLYASRTFQSKTLPDVNNRRER